MNHHDLMYYYQNPDKVTLIEFGRFDRVAKNIPESLTCCRACTYKVHEPVHYVSPNSGIIGTKEQIKIHLANEIRLSANYTTKTILGLIIVGFSAMPMTLEIIVYKTSYPNDAFTQFTQYIAPFFYGFTVIGVIVGIIMYIFGRRQNNLARANLKSKYGKVPNRLDISEDFLDFIPVINFPEPEEEL